MSHIESNLQIACVKWFRLQYPRIIVASFPNGGHRNKVTASIMKAEGAMSGMPDLFIPFPKHGYHGLFIEMKSSTGRLSANQKAVIETLRMQGYSVHTCTTLEEFMDAVNDYLSKPRVCNNCGVPHEWINGHQCIGCGQAV